jgi:hypothetical protein
MEQKNIKKYWFRNLSSANSNLKLFQQSNNHTYFLQDDEHTLNLLSSHNQSNHNSDFFLMVKN